MSFLRLYIYISVPSLSSVAAEMRMLLSFSSTAVHTAAGLFAPQLLQIQSDSSLPETNPGQLEQEKEPNPVLNSVASAHLGQEQSIPSSRSNFLL